MYGPRDRHDLPQCSYWLATECSPVQPSSIFTKRNKKGKSRHFLRPPWRNQPYCAFFSGRIALCTPPVTLVLSRSTTFIFIISFNLDFSLRLCCCSLWLGLVHLLPPSAFLTSSRRKNPFPKVFIIFEKKEKDR